MENLWSEEREFMDDWGGGGPLVLLADPNHLLYH